MFFTEEAEHILEFTEHRAFGRPTHAPQIAPIEFAFSFIKTYLRKKGVLFNKYTLKKAIRDAIFAITAEMCKNWFVNCGY